MKTNTKVSLGILGGFLATSLGTAGLAFADTTVNDTNGMATYDENVQVVVPEILSVSVTSPTSAAKGGTSDFLRDYYQLKVMSNNASGWKTTMTTDENSTDANGGTALTHKTLGTNYFVPSLKESVTREKFISSNAGSWGYSTDDTGKTDNSETAVNTAATYAPLVAKDGTAIELSGASSSAPGELSEDIYFGMMPKDSLAAGTYATTVIFKVVTTDASSTSTDVPVDPGTIATDENWTNNNGTYTYKSDNDITATVSTTTGTDTETTNVTVKDASPLGVTNEVKTVSTAAAANTAAAIAVGVGSLIMSSAFFLALARRPEEGEEDEDEI